METFNIKNFNSWEKLNISDDFIKKYKAKVFKRLENQWLNKEELKKIFNFIEKIPKTDSFNFLRYIALKNVLEKINHSDILKNYIENNQLRWKNNINVLKTRKVEDIFLGIFLKNKYDFLELSPLNPLWTANLIWKSFPNKTIITWSNKELQVDPTYTLTLEWARKIKEWQEEVSLCTLWKSIRNQTFSNPLYYPYFTTWSWIKILSKDTSLKKFDEEIAKTINENISFLQELREKWFWIEKINLQLSDWMILYKILKDKLNLSNSQVENLVYNYRKKYWNWCSSNILTDLWIDEKSRFSLSEIEKSSFYKKFKNILDNLDIKNIDVINIDFSRLTWLWHYNGTIFTLFIEWNDWIKTDIIDWWSVNWINELLNTKWYKQVVFWAWTELIWNNF